MKLLNLRYHDGLSPLSMAHPFDRLTTESVLYQAFLLAARRPFSPNFHVDSEFLVHTESILDCRKLLGVLPTDSYPVLGVPVTLFRHILDIIDFHNPNTERHQTESLIYLRTSMDYWESVIFDGSVMDYCPPYMREFYADTVTLFVLASSILLDWITACSTSSGARLDISQFLKSTFNSPSASGCVIWQLETAISILRQPEFIEPWSRCFIGAWPMLIFGYAAFKDEDIALLRMVLSQTCHRVGYGEIQRILDELEVRWASMHAGIETQKSHRQDACNLTSY